MWAALGAYADEPVPAGFADRVMARVRPEAAGATPLRVLAGGRLRGLAIAASLVASLGAGVLLSQRFLVREAAPVAAPTAALEAVPADLLDNEGARDPRLPPRRRLRGAPAARPRRHGDTWTPSDARAAPSSSRCSPLALGAAWGFVGPSSARADEPPPVAPPREPPAPAPGGTVGPAAVDRLTAEELEILRRRFPDWDQRDAAERERIALQRA